MSLHILIAQMELHEKIKHHEIVKRVDIQDEKTLLIILKRFDADTLHVLPGFYGGFKVNHKVEGEENLPKKINPPKKKEEKKKNTSGSGAKSYSEGNVSNSSHYISVEGKVNTKRQGL